MKIGILTQPLHNNYGGILQNYALQTVLKQLGYEPVTINVQYPEKQIPFSTRAIKFIWRIFKKLRGDRRFLFCDLKRHYEFVNRPGIEQKRFIDAYINQISYNEPLTSEFCKRNIYDAFVVGSDQVWRPGFSPFISNYFLDFTKGFDVQRISYAASFGTDSWEGTPIETSRLAELARKFNSISVREKSGKEVCKKVFNVDATWVLDPTLLLKKEDYEQLFTSPAKKEKYVAIYVLDMTHQIDSIIKTICKEKNLKPVYLGVPTKKGYPSIESWLSGIFCSEFVVTDSFHGTVFSILSHKPFATVVNVGRGATRFDSLLGSLGLLDRLVTNDCSVINVPVDYDNVEELLKEYRVSSLNFLKQALNG